MQDWWSAACGLRSRWMHRRCAPHDHHSTGSMCMCFEALLLRLPGTGHAKPASRNCRPLSAQIPSRNVRLQLFLEYRHAGSEPSDVTFNLKDFRAMLALCEGLNANMSVSFEAPGSPVVVKPHVARQQVRV